MSQQKTAETNAAGKNTAKIRLGAWYAEESRSLRFPEGWEVHCLNPNDAPEIDGGAVRAAFENPIGAPRLRASARGKRNAIIAVDDLTRPTPVQRVLPTLLEELAAGGLESSQIRILLGGAAHRPMQPDEIERKLGPGVASRYQVIQHDFMGSDLRHLGWIEGGPVQLNGHFLDAELRISVGGVIPHNETGYGGGSKMVVPGVAAASTTTSYSKRAWMRTNASRSGAPGFRFRSRMSPVTVIAVAPFLNSIMATSNGVCSLSRSGWSGSSLLLFAELTMTRMRWSGFTTPLMSVVGLYCW